MKLPNQRNIVLRDIFVGTDESHLFGNGGCDKKAVKGVSVKQRQRFINGKMRRLNREKDKTVRFNVVYKISRISVNFQFSYVQFNCNFPSGYYTQIYLVGKRKDYFFGGFGKGIVAAKIPNRRVCPTNSGPFTYNPSSPQAARQNPPPYGTSLSRSRIRPFLRFSALFLG